MGQIHIIRIVPGFPLRGIDRLHRNAGIIFKKSVKLFAETLDVFRVNGIFFHIKIFITMQLF